MPSRTINRRPISQTNTQSKRRRELPAPLLCSREQSAAMLGMSVGSILRLEQTGRLDKVRPHGPQGMVYHRIEQVHQIAGCEDDAGGGR
jgi:hypothetical protein